MQSVETRLAEGWTGSATMQVLREGSGLLGSTYSGGELDFGRSHHTSSLTLTSTYDITPDTSLVADGTMEERTAAAANPDSLLERAPCSRAELSLALSNAMRSARATH